MGTVVDFRVLGLLLLAEGATVQADRLVSMLWTVTRRPVPAGS